MSFTPGAPSRKCATSGCERNHLWRTSYCLACLDKLERTRAVKFRWKRGKKRQAATSELAEVHKPTGPVMLVFDATCGVCSLSREYRWTMDYYRKVVLVVGMRCGRCHGHLVEIKQALATEYTKILELMEK